MSMGYLFHELLGAGLSSDEWDAMFLFGMVRKNYSDGSSDEESYESDDSKFEGVPLTDLELKCATINAMRQYNNHVWIEYNEQTKKYYLDIRSQIGSSVRTVEQMRSDYLCSTNPESVDPIRSCKCYFCKDGRKDPKYLHFIKGEYDKLLEDNERLDSD